VRTPFGRFGGALARVLADDLAALAVSELVGRNPVGAEVCPERKEGPM
jgi:3-oxoadipyl-CoA thiolase